MSFNKMTNVLNFRINTSCLSLIYLIRIPNSPGAPRRPPQNQNKDKEHAAHIILHHKVVDDINKFMGVCIYIDIYYSQL